MAEPAVKPISLEELAALEDHSGLRHELWDGQPLAMTGGTRTHNIIALGLYRSLHRQRPPSCEAYVANMGLRLDAPAYSNKAYPDVMVVCKPQDGIIQIDPVLIAEVLSESSVARDRNQKFKAYTTLASLETYLIVSQTAVEIEVYRHANHWAEDVYRGEHALIELSRPALCLPLREIYQDVWAALTGRPV